ncbi:F-box domain containing protein [Trema orientale]|uniref:F-box domain containing protein n=1 Tax=Trema orientale TaxID=63057 RepID=A0A2P5FIM7_TREOI|nr:F-box domain containing protein [Trema orientale]
MDRFSRDIIQLIFSKLPAKNLVKLRCVCKRWNREDNRFWEIGCHDIPEFNLDEYKLGSSCNGILCFSRETRDHIWMAYLLNPCRKEILKLPPHDLKAQSYIFNRKYGLGFDRATSEYKVVCISLTIPRESGKRSAETEIYTLGSKSSSSRSWRALSQDIPSLITRFESIFYTGDGDGDHHIDERAIYAGGVLYWVNSEKREELYYFGDNTESNYFEETYYNKLFTFHMGKEEFRLISHPNVKHYYYSYHLVDLRGVLGFVGHSAVDLSHIKVWTLEDYDGELWSKRYSIKIGGVPKYNATHVIGPWENGKLLLRYRNSFVAYNPNTHTLINIRIPQLKPSTLAFSFTGSLVSLFCFKVEEGEKLVVEDQSF